MTYLSSLPHSPGETPRDNRTINYLRISVTDRCNLACRYCVPKQDLPFVTHADVARYEELLTIVEAAAELGITKIRITGGEPLVRKGLFGFIKNLSDVPGIEDIAITTNGVLLEKNMDALVASGVRRLNISLDTLSPEIFKQITGKDRHAKVWRGIMAAHDRGIAPIKLNMVPLRGINEDDIEKMARLVLSYPFHVRFIEYMPMGNSGVTMDQQMLIPEISARVEAALGSLTPMGKGKHDGPARRFTAKHALGEIGFISPVSSHFCHQCNRLRLTSTGMLRPCLLHNYETDILSIVRNGGTCDDIKSVILETIANKPLQHSLGEKAPEKINSQMFTIGG
ncbi:cyclic pyranopterin monophosphate synthase subunit MoaA [Desulfocicer vacuolatum DSM 3385]|uniref:Cyclic pyranopterin monophosphate synthase subunit MoaA n=1 Tax=Desulfocicer vacuolatum DSM 3385 TaxID=1121400 RepID=A0A1W1YHT2_9BACT|nr:GTP 3',8-cyclase MoaA [Desulfocicer vacuolatum]SMC35719.1 cyclic pyranopterin monophosphate synthase subunit MoaA [Desulfocicer vacuolatum DSM 3385]